MHLDQAGVAKVADLARIAVSDDELAALQASLEDILCFVDQLEQADADEVAPMAHPLDAVQRLRPDTVTEPDQREAFQAIAPAVDAGLYLVPKVIE
ncbi:MAG: Asp-tRNA(Asn)/Glu-tRNA(Gln) amidotransferase subunit GatC [Thioalkalivibrionaceae bacterium]